MWPRQRDSSALASVGGFGVGAAPTRSIPEPSELVLAVARVLHVNGQSTDETVAAAERLSSKLGLRATLIPRWEELELRARYETTSVVSVEAGSPTGVDMDRVASAMGAMDEIGAGRLAPTAATEKINAIAKAQPAPTWLFTLAAAAGAAALAVIFGVQHLAAVALIIISAAAGAVLRRTLRGTARILSYSHSARPCSPALLVRSRCAFT